MTASCNLLQTSNYTSWAKAVSFIIRSAHEPDEQQMYGINSVEAILRHTSLDKSSAPIIHKENRAGKHSSYYAIVYHQREGKCKGKQFTKG